MSRCRPAARSARRVLREQDAVGGERQVAQPRLGREQPDQRRGRGAAAARRPSAAPCRRRGRMKTSTSRRSPRSCRISSRGSQTYSSSGMQYAQRRLHRSVTEMRRLRSGRPKTSSTGAIRPPPREPARRSSALPLPDQARLPHADLEVVPRHPLVRGALAGRVELRIALPLAQRAAPVAVEARGLLQEVGHAAVPAGQQGLERRLARVLVQHAHVGERAAPPS